MRIVLDARQMAEREAAHSYLAKKLDFPEYYGKNLDALYECLCELGESKLCICHAREAGGYYTKVEKVLKKAAQDSEGAINIVVECGSDQCYNKNQERNDEAEGAAMLEFKYDTQLLIEGEDLDEDVISEYFTENFKGDCLLAVGDEELIKIHFHTNEPWKVLEYCASIGEIYDIVVEDMDRQSIGLKG